MRVLPIEISPSDIRFFKCEVGWKTGIFLERHNPGKEDTRLNVVIGRVPEDAQPPLGRIPDAELLKLADQGLKQVEPEVLARIPIWSYIHPHREVPDDTPVEEFRILPPSQKDRAGEYIEPPNAYEPLAPPAPPPTPAEKPVKTAKE